MMRSGWTPLISIYHRCDKELRKNSAATRIKTHTGLEITEIRTFGWRMEKRWGHVENHEQRRRGRRKNKVCDYSVECADLWSMREPCFPWAATVQREGLSPHTQEVWQKRHLWVEAQAPWWSMKETWKPEGEPQAENLPYRSLSSVRYRCTVWEPDFDQPVHLVSLYHSH